jgi:hypothetical protein
MTLPVVKSDLIRTLGEQMQSGNMDYVANVEKELWKENPNLAAVCNMSMEVLNGIFAKHSGDEDELLSAAQTVGRTTYLLMYQALKQQDICDELNG